MMKLYGHPFSSYTWKAMIPLYDAGLDFTFCQVDSDAGHAAFVQSAHPAGKFPVLADGDTVVVEATAIIEYLAATQAQCAHLLPSDARQAVRARMLDRVFDNYVMTNMSRVVLAHLANSTNPDATEIASARSDLRKAYDWLEADLTSHALPPHVSLVSCAAAPSLFYADWVEEIGPHRPRLLALRAALLSLPAVRRCVEDARPYRSYFPPGAPDRD